MIGVPVSDSDSADKLKQYVSENEPPYQLSYTWTDDQQFQFRKIAVSKTRRHILPTTIIANANGDVLEIIVGIPSVSDIIRLMSE